MKLFNSMGPNPKVVRMFMAELGVECEVQEVDLMGGENRQAAFLEINPTGTCPALEMDDGSYCLKSRLFVNILQNVREALLWWVKQQKIVR